MTTKQFDVCVKTREYVTAEGERKNAYQNVGAVLDAGNGPFLVLEAWFNPAGADRKNGKVLLSLFAPKE